MGERATPFAIERLEGRTVRLAVDSEADRRGSFDRLRVDVSIDGAKANEGLLANIVDVTPVTWRSRFDELPELRR